MKYAIGIGVGLAVAIAAFVVWRMRYVGPRSANLNASAPQQPFQPQLLGPTFTTTPNSLTPGAAAIRDAAHAGLAPRIVGSVASRSTQAHDSLRDQLVDLTP